MREGNLDEVSKSQSMNITSIRDRDEKKEEANDCFSKLGGAQNLNMKDDKASKSSKPSRPGKTSGFKAFKGIM